jgi:hypothetical protein
MLTFSTKNLVPILNGKSSISLYSDVKVNVTILFELLYEIEPIPIPLLLFIGIIYGCALLIVFVFFTIFTNLVLSEYCKITSSIISLVNPSNKTKSGAIKYFRCFYFWF